MSGANPDPENQNALPPEKEPAVIGRKLAWAVLLLISFLLVVVGWLGHYSSSPSTIEDETIVLIPKGAGVKNIARILVGKGLIKEDVRFPILARMTGTAGRLRAGEYLIPPHVSPLEILHLLEKGDVMQHQVTIPEGLNLDQVSNILTKNNWVDKSLFLQLATDPELLRSLGIAQSSLEGYLFPDTYLFTRGNTTEVSIITMMVRRFHKVWKDITISTGQTSMSRHEVITLASIIEKETGTSSERPLIARVFLNRLQRNMRLQSDPTVIYGLEDFDGNLTRAHLQEQNKYNTYVIKGLPPGPICSPGRASIEAVFNPADATYLYFVAKNDGTHYFSKTLGEHNRAVRQFQKKK